MKTTAKDLSHYHEQITDLFQWPQSPKDWEQYRLTQEQVDFFHEYGYLSNIKLLNDQQVAALNNELAAITDPSHPGNQLFYEFNSNESTDPNAILFHALGAWRISPGFHDVLWNPAFVVAAKQLLNGQRIRFWHDQLFCKPAQHGGVVAWHQDYSYWTRTVPMQHLTCWMGLDDASTENGCLYYVPGSHKWGLLDKPELAGDMEGLFDYLDDQQKQAFQPIPIVMKQGYGTFHHPLLVHGSYANTSDRSRRALVLNVFADGTLSNSNEEVLQGVPIIHKGEKMQGQFFPLLNPESALSQ
ncbi:phytanoyl-CoA dioxygenase family protein [Olivibacter sp. SDN3]|uniref:phytanoyl-CoA dioxygenase family protein n=1 Tax=Olivibacter sp. SDN3 TaxID=2764720 RepID=UPI00165152EC|nr:phytanoyl-CoA dioxygenase family protein [Olivibacter sp. SDN3]QNL51736.1 phytanoyl-CoA dioxygenase family protein [Olivibacter sp. SDN3]